jgi:hypothetical protein
MKLFIFSITIYSFLFSILSINLICQVQIDSNLTQIHSIIDNKLFLQPNDIIKRTIDKYQIANHLDKVNYPKITAIQENIVSDNQNPESEFHAVMNPLDTNVILVSPMKQVALSLDYQIQCPIYYTHDFGKTWNKSNFQNRHSIDNGLLVGGGDPMFAFDANGKAYFSWISLVISLNLDSVFSVMYWASSTNNGTSWKRETDDRIAHSGSILDFQNQMLGLTLMHDKEWMACDRSNSTNKNNLYTALTVITETNNVENSRIVLYKKPTDSIIFNKDSVIVSSGNYDATQFATIDVDNDGYVHVCFFGLKGNLKTLYHSISIDGGKSFAPEKKISDLIFSGSKLIPNSDGDSIVGVSKGRFYPSPQFAIDKSNKQTSGNLYEVWTALGVTKDEGNGNDIYFSRSTDYGQNWSNPKIVNNDIKGVKCNQFYPSIAVNKNGVIVVGWYDRRNDPHDIITDYYIGISTDDGVTFNNIKVTIQPTDFSTVFDMSPSYFGIGEYTQLLATDGYAIPIWTDGRNGDGNLDIYSAFISLDKPDAVERIEQINSSISFSDPVPNPATNEVRIKLNFPKPVNADLLLTDLHGKIIKSFISKKFEIGDENIVFSVSDLSYGEYYLVLSSELGHLMRKLVIMR